MSVLQNLLSFDNVTTTFVVFVVVFLLTFAYMKTGNRKKNFPPGPAGWPIIGNLLFVYKDKHNYLTIYKLYEQYGPLIGLDFCGLPAVIVSETDLLKELIVNQGECSSNRTSSFLPSFKYSPVSFIGLDYDKRFKKLKKVALTALRELGLGTKAFEEMIQCEVNNVKEEVGRHVGLQYRFDKIFNLASGNLLCLILYGKRYEYTDAELTTLVEYLNLLFQNGGLGNPVIMASDWILRILLFFKAKNIGRTLQNRRNIDEFGEKQIRKHKDAFDPSNKKDLIDMFIAAEIDDNDMQAIVSAFFIAGFETTSTTLLWSFLLMAKYPAVQERCRKEILKVIGRERSPSMADKDSLTYVCATLMEIQRFATLVPLGVFHSTSEDVSLNGYFLPKKTMILCNLYAIHMNAKYWDEPKCFKPQRFIDEDGKLLYSVDNFMPFGIGRRSCLGENLAKLEHFLFFTSLVQKFKFSVADPHSLPDPDDGLVGITLAPPVFTLDVNYA